MYSLISFSPAECKTAAVMRQPREAETGEWAVDVCNDRIVQAFRFCFCFTPLDTRLQQFMRWDSDSEKKTREYTCVYLLKDPVPIRDRTKAYFVQAFSLLGPASFARQQEYYWDREIAKGMKAVGARTVEEFLGIK